MDELKKKFLTLCGKASKEYIYYAPALTRVRIEKDDDRCPTMSMSPCFVMRYNSEFVKSISDQNLTQLILHEILHYLSKHHQRYTQNPYKDKISFDAHNIAMDIEINQHLDSDWITKNGMTYERFKYPKGKSYEEYIYLLYNDVEKRKEELKQQAKNGKQQQNGNDENGNQKESDKSSHNMSKEEIIDSLAKGEILKDFCRITMEGGDGELTQKDLDNMGIDSSIDELQEMCKKASQDVGKGSGVELVREVKTKKYKWDTVLRNIVTSKFSTSCFGFDYQTYQKFNKRLSPQSSEIIFPSKYAVSKKLNLVVGIDVSGSMGDLVNEMYARLKSLIETIGFESSCTVLECDSCIQSVTESFDWSTNKIKSHGGGGTDMEQIPKWVKKEVDERKREEPDLIVIMTDNYVDWDNQGLYPKKTVVLSDNISDTCPYKQYEVLI